MKVSVIVPAYNVGEHIAQTLRSLSSALLPEAFAGLTLPDIGALPESLALPDGFAISASFADTYAGARDGGATEALLGEVFAP